LVLSATVATAVASAPVKSGWLVWRGPKQDGVSPEKGLPETFQPGGPTQLWSLDFGGAGTPVIAGDRLYALGYRGQGVDLQEVLLCADANTGKKLWEHTYSDFLSDIAYDRYAIGEPAVDPETGNVYVLLASGQFLCYTPEGKLVWRLPMMEQYGRLTFTNGRNGSPLILDDLVITRYVTSNWGGEGAAADRFYAFDKKTGELVWSSTPGERPKDNSFALPLVAMHKGKQVLYSGDGSGNVVCLNARTGQPIWRYPISAGGCNSSVVLHKNKVIIIHADENLDSSDSGRQAAINVDATPQPQETGTPLLPKDAQVWNNKLAAVSSSPVLVGDRIYQVIKTGELCCVDANTGKVMWEHKLGPDVLHSSPTYGDGKLYVPLQNGSFFIIKPTDQGAQELSKAQLPGRCLGAPAIANGKVYVLSTEKLYCFGKPGKAGAPAPTPPTAVKAGKPVALQVIPAEVLLRPGQTAKFRVRGIDENGFVTGTYPATQAKWTKFIPPTARVKSEMSASVNAQGELVADAGSTASAGAWQVEVDGLKGYIRGRVMPDLPFKEDFNGYNLAVDHATEGVKFAFPPLPWIGARLKWEVRDVNGEKALAKTLDNIFFQRSTAFFGHPDMKNYVVEADLMADGNRRTTPSVGLINQRYLVRLMGNAQQLEVTSNEDRVRVNVPFAWTYKTWYHMKTQVDVAPDGTGMVRAKAWKRGDAEPANWTIEVPHRTAHTEGAPGFYGFTPNNTFRVYIDNISVTPKR
jgi:outer membrane protein assembly factor BamB